MGNVQESSVIITIKQEIRDFSLQAHFTL